MFCEYVYACERHKQQVENSKSNKIETILEYKKTYKNIDTFRLLVR